MIHFCARNFLFSLAQQEVAVDSNLWNVVPRNTGGLEEFIRSNIGEMHVSYDHDAIVTQWPTLCECCGQTVHFPVTGDASADKSGVGCRSASSSPTCRWHAISRELQTGRSGSEVICESNRSAHESQVLRWTTRPSLNSIPVHKAHET